MKLTKDLITRIAVAVASAATLDVAAASARVDKKELREWVDRALQERRRREEGEAPRKSEVLCLRLLEQLEYADAAWEVRDLQIIGEAAKKWWQAAAWRLERRHPERWAQRTRTPINTKEEVREEGLDLSCLTKEELIEVNKAFELIELSAHRRKGRKVVNK